MDERTWGSSQLAVSLLALAFVLYLAVEGRVLIASMELAAFYGSMVLAALAAIVGAMPSKPA